MGGLLLFPSVATGGVKVAIRVVCSACLRRLTFKHSESGLNRKCPGCGAELTVPGDVVPVVGGKAPRSEYDIRKMEFIIAGVILVAALAGAYIFIKWYQKNSPVADANSTTSPTPTPTATVATKKPVVANNVARPGAKLISALLKSREEIKLGPASANVLALNSVAETPINKTRPSSGKAYAVVRLDLKSVDTSRLFDTYQLFIVTPDAVERSVVAVVGVDDKGLTYEIPRKRVDSTEISGSTLKCDLFFLVPVDPATDKANLDVLELKYK